MVLKTKATGCPSLRGSRALGGAGRVLGDARRAVGAGRCSCWPSPASAGISVPAATPALMARRSSVSLISSPSRYLFIRSSSALDGALDQLLAVARDGLAHRGGNLALGRFVARVGVRLAGDEIDDAAQKLACSPMGTVSGATPEPKWLRSDSSARS